ncbi:MAG: type II toxin-antitoxin system HicA family toxin [Baekduia sp.]
MAKKFREVRRALRKAGWTLARTRGDHEQWLSPDGRSVVTVAGKDNKDVPVGTLKSIRQSTGLEDLR